MTAGLPLCGRHADTGRHVHADLARAARDMGVCVVCLDDMLTDAAEDAR